MRSVVTTHHHGNHLSQRVPSSITGSRSSPVVRRAEKTASCSSSSAVMVKLGTNLADKMEKQPCADDGFDNIPLITPLEVSQLQQSFADKVIVKTSTHYQLQQQKKKKSKFFIPNIEKLNISLYKDVSDRAKITGLILIMLAFLTSLLLLLMYKAMWYNRLTCPEGFILQQRHCTPTALELFPAEQPNPPDVQGGNNPGLYTALSRLNQVKRAGPELPWLPVIRALKETDRTKEESHQQAKSERAGDE
ncbi:calcyon neuron-specific vesicular protein isoform X1 [Nerophis ophidion]|uniref:calcyon neuron-specific vesicular protein isoform X1 n=1 Tax=Nerophis ophidion TaxID=159077 RepID=UPI002AE01558|nr:calcyon neuron-specific vesicular protein isoform X1 [Nerophis ophidion]XP_061736449.1 calcyon neuron-specific vesicular protein isoform X1 [Nerophis ophidion]